MPKFVKQTLIWSTCLFLPLTCVTAETAIDARTYIPKNAGTYLPLVKTEVKTYFGELTIPWYAASLIEHESCISLTHSKCWNPASRFKTAREEGGGLGQLTRVYNPNGTIRFDSLAGMRQKYANELRDLSWSVLYTRPDLQIRALVLMSRDNYRALSMVPAPLERLAMADAAYNGGLGGVQKERRACGLRKGCDPNKWFGNVEKTCLKSKAVLYGKRNACDINRNHVVEVLTLRLNKYKPYFIP